MSGLPDGWEIARLEELCDWSSGGTPRRSEPTYFGGEVPWITISDLNDGSIAKTAERLTEAGVANSAAKLVPKDTVLVALYGSIGKLGVTSAPSTTNQAIACALPNAQAFDPLYLFHFLRARRNELAAQGTGVTQKNIYLGDIKGFVAPVAPRNEQTRIVEKLEELLSDLDAGVAELKAAQKKLAQYRQSLLKAAVEGALTAEWRQQHPPAETGAQLLQRILAERRARWETRQLAKFKEQGKAPPKDWQKKYPEPVQPETSGLPALPQGWGWATLDQLVADSCYGTSVKCSYESGGTPVLRIPNVSGGILDLHDMKFATSDLALGKDDHLSVGDLLVIRTNGSVGLVGRAAAVVTELKIPHYFASYLLRLRSVETTCVHRWMLTVLSAHTGRQWLEVRAASSAGQHNISLSTLLTMPVPLPPLLEQQAVLQELDAGFRSIHSQGEVLEHSLKQSTAQRQNILRAAFAGQLVPQDPADEPASVLLARIRAERATAGTVQRKARGLQAKEHT